MSLLKFFFSEKCSHCGERIEKGASFCRHCGAGRASSWRKCTACGVSVAADSQFCWSCNANLSAQPRDQFFSDRWRRTPGIFATRATIETPQDRLRHGIQVDDGTLGALFKDGTLRSELAPGYHTQTSFWDRLTGGGKTGGFVEAVICASDPVTSFVGLGESAALFTSDRSAVEAAVIVKVQLADLATFTRRLMPTGTDSVRDDDLMLPHTARVAEVIRRHLSRLSVNDVAKSVELRHELEAALGQELPGLLADYGLTYRGVEDVRLESHDIQRIREAEGDLARLEREKNWEKLKREMEHVAKLGEIKDEMALKEQVENWSHEANLTQLERDHVFKMQKQARSHIQELQAAKNEIEIKRVKRDWEDEDDRRDLALLDEIRIRNEAALQRKHERDQAEKEAEVNRQIRLAQGIKDVRSDIVAGVLPGDHGRRVIDAVLALRPLPQVTVIQQSLSSPISPPMPRPSFMPAGTPSFMTPAPSSLEILAQRYLPSVGIVVVGQEGGPAEPIGTAWLIAGRNALATNAHVAVDVTAALNQHGMSAWIIFSGQSSPQKIRSARIHHEYAQSQAKGHPVPSFDVALLELENLLPQGGLPIAGRGKLLALRELQSVAYLGFPMENLAASAASMERPKAIAKKGSLSSLEDWMMRHSDDPSQRLLIKHDLGVAGGASGSPLFDEAGDVIGLISAGNMERLYDPQTKQFRRVPNGVLLNFAQRIDVLLDWMGW